MAISRKWHKDDKYYNPQTGTYDYTQAMLEVKITRVLLNEAKKKKLSGRKADFIIIDSLGI